MYLQKENEADYDYYRITAFKEQSTQTIDTGMAGVIITVWPNITSLGSFITTRFQFLILHKHILRCQCN